MPGFELIRATDADAPRVHALLAAAGAALARDGFGNWDPPFPLAQVRAEIAARHVMRVVDGGRDVATWSLGLAPVRGYEPGMWDTARVAAYLNRLAVDPARQGGGVGAWCLRAIDAQAVALGAGAVRCDVLAANTRLCGFYERHGYRRRGSRAHSGWTFACYERAFD